MPNQKQRRTANGQMIPRGRPWRKGQSGNPNGRPRRLLKPIPPELLETVRTLARYVLHHPVYQDNLGERVFLGRAPALERLIWLFAYGTPAQTMKHDGQVGFDFAALLQQADQLRGYDPRQPKALPQSMPIIVKADHGRRNGTAAVISLPDEEDDNEEVWPGDLPREVS